MKKFAFILSFLFCLSFLFGCNGKPTLIENLSELRTDVFYGESENYKLKASYGFKESPFINDGKVGKTEYALEFRLLEKTDDASYSISFPLNGSMVSANFSPNPVSHVLCARVQTEGFKEKEFSVTISCGGNQETIVLKSLLPQNTITFDKALSSLYNGQKDFIDTLYDQNGNFNAEIYLRVLVKDQKPYWYVGLARGNNDLKALLIDGLDGKILAIREIF